MQCNSSNNKPEEGNTKSDENDDADQEDCDFNKENEEDYVYRHLSFDPDDVYPGRFVLVSHENERHVPWIGKVTME